MKAITLNRCRGTGFLADYTVARTLREEDAARGTPRLSSGRWNGRRVIIKTWSHAGAAQADLRALWHEEVRSLRLLSAQRSEDQLIAPILDAGDDESGFHLIVSCADRHLLGDRSKHDQSQWTSIAERVQLWRGLERLSRALQTLHDHGLTHRGLDEWSVLTKDNGEPDFQLTGFEWATRCLPDDAVLDSTENNSAIAPEGAAIKDWRALARLARKLLPPEELDESELQVLLTMESSSRLDGKRVESSIRKALQILAPNEAKTVDGERPRKIGAWDAGSKSQGFLLLQVLQSLLVTNTEFPVEIVSRVDPDSRATERNYVYLRSRVHRGREALWKSLNSQGTLTQRLHDSLTEISTFLTDTWYLIDESNDDGRVSEQVAAELSFVEDSPERVYKFETSGTVPRTGRGLLVSGKGGRSDQQFRRQLKAWRAMGEHRQLLRVLATPAEVTHRSQIKARDPERLQELDPSKRETLGAALATEPLFLVQGPPGVGKTRLVAEVCHQVLLAEPNSKLLLAAQSHAAVDNLLKAISEAALDRCLIVRSRANDPSRSAGKYDVQSQVNRLLAGLRDSPWLQECSHVTRDTVMALIASGNRERGTDVDRFHRRPLESLLLRASSLVFATANSASLEHLLSNHVQFDWSIIEEAAKATGNELVGALLLAQRYLMIGDHQQLPPFNADKLSQLLNSPQKLGELFDVIRELALPQWDEREVQRLHRKFAEQEGGRYSPAAQRICEAAKKQLMLFESLITTPKDADAPVFTSVLWHQHRMHPTLSGVVSHAFYDDRLLNAQTCEERFRSNPPLRSVDPERLPNIPLIWIDTPWVQNSLGVRVGERRPGPQNSAEVTAVLQVIRTLSPEVDKKPSLAILSPYRRQVKALSEAIATAGRDTRQRLQMFARVGGSYAHTVDSFQGSEADVVIVSLVRNNDHASVTGALGFLQDERRMNVLFSRAKWRLIVVGSQDFLRHVLANRPEADTERVRFLEKLFNAFDSAQAAGHAVTVPSGQLPGRPME